MSGVDGGTDAVEALARTEYERLVRAVALSCGSLATAEDSVQEAFGRAWRRAADGATFDHLAGWVVTVALNEARRVGRRERRAGAHLDDPHESRAPDLAAVLDLRAAVLALPTRQREVVVLHYFLDWPIAAIAGALGVSEGNVKNALFRGRASLADHLAIDEEEAAR
jgi:RNA polymerase sigma factor (sigma-70 family)